VEVVTVEAEAMAGWAGGRTIGWRGEGVWAERRGQNSDVAESGSESEHRHPDRPRKVWLQGDFLLHCHVEMHMMDGMAAIVRAIQDVEVTPELEETRLERQPGHGVLSPDEFDRVTSTRVRGGR
jgi:hypothetical protein